MAQSATQSSRRPCCCSAAARLLCSMARVTRNPSAAAEALFKMAAQAYATLSDPALRRRYDAQRALAQATDAAAAAYAR